jgi:hypothetical protein
VSPSEELLRVAVCFAKLEAQLRKAPVRRGGRSLTIEFRVATSPPSRWSYDPERAKQHFSRGASPRADLRIHCSPRFIESLWNRQVTVDLDDPDQLESVGELAALDELTQRLFAARSIIDVRARSMP